MKKIFTLAFSLMLACGVFAETKTANFTVNPQMSCQNCENKIKENMRFENGVKSVKPSAKSGIVEITYDDAKTDVAQLQDGFKKIGYQATPVDATNTTETKSCGNHQGCQGHQQKTCHQEKQGACQNEKQSGCQNEKEGEGCKNKAVNAQGSCHGNKEESHQKCH